ncbi:MAG TPA: choice-of-anchor Q domain-containing protein, partial [Urbifossiella sp.]|nr:choice-of-anchor Q domain-containing protein [Urbifossiella sp.]
MSRRQRPRVERLEDRTTPAQFAPGTIFVSTLADVVDGDTSSADALAANPGSDGAISLTEAMRAAEADPDPNAIALPDGPAGATILLDGSTLDPRSLAADPDSAGPSQYVVTTPISIFVKPATPAGLPQSGVAIVRGGDAPAFRLFHVRPGGSLDLNSVELRGGLALGGSGANGGGGAAGLGGAILNQGDLIVLNSTLTGNAAVGGAGGVRDVESFAGGGGGGLGASATGFDGGGPNGGEGTGEGSGDPGGFGGGGGGGTSGGDGGFGGGGAAGNPFFGKAGVGGFGAGSGAGASSGSGSATTTPGGFGGGDGGQSGGGGAGMGGAIFNLGGTVRVANSTVFGNGAAGGLSGDGEGSGQGFGGGLFNLNGTAVVVSSTFAANRADDGGAVYNLAATGTGNDAVLTVRNSILVDSADAAAEVVNSRLVSDGTNAVLTATDPSLTNGGGVRNDGGDADVSGVRAATRPVVVAALAENGGPTPTLLPTPDSEAIDAGGPDAPDDGQDMGLLLRTDQRGLSRPSGPGLDLGAVEVQRIPNDGPPPPPTLGPIPLDTVVFTSPDGVTVRNAPPGAAPQADPFPGFGGDTRVAVADLDGDGFDDYVYAPGAGGGPHIRIIDGRTGEGRLSFFGFAPDFRG